MAINFLNTVDLNSIQVENIVPENATAGTIGAGVIGQMYFDTAQDTMMQYVANSDGAGNPGYIEIGTTSGVETFSNTNVGSTYVDFSVVNASAIGDVNIGFADLNAVDGTSTAADRFLTKANKWATIPFGDITAVLPGTYINVDNSTGPEPTINHDLTTRTDTTSTASPGYGATFTTIDTVTTNTTGHITALNVKTVTLAADTIYTLPVTALAGNQARVSLTPSVGAVTSTVDLIGTAGRIAITSQDQNNGSVTIDFPDDVTIVGELTVQGTGTSTFAGPVSLTGDKLLAVADGTAATDGVNLGQVEALVAGIGLFKGGYNATTGLTTDLGAGNNGSLDGASNIALDQGDFFVVTTDGTAFYGVTLEVGDMIFANTTIPASSSPPISDYTVVIQDANIAGSGATDGGTQKGVAGFDSANFNVSAAGWVQIKPLSRLNGRKQTLNDTSPVTRTFLNGLTTFEIDLADPSLFDTGALAEDVTVEVTQDASPYQTVYADVTRSGSASMSIIFSGNVAIDTYRVLLEYV